MGFVNRLHLRNRLMLELMARGGMRIGEVLKLRANNVNDRKLFLLDPKSGRQIEIVFIPKKVADRLREYIAAEGIREDNRVFPLGYTRAREIVKNAGNKIGVFVKPHDLRRHAATYASRSGVPIEIVFIPKKVADRLREYIAAESIEEDNRVFPLGYTRAREIVKNAGNKIGVFVKPHDLRRHAATYASRSGVPIEIVSKTILRHSNLSTTQRYLGKVSDNEAIYWIENIYR